jgi:uncharacterized protein YjbI with pentapeptide repeats
MADVLPGDADQGLGDRAAADRRYLDVLAQGQFWPALARWRADNPSGVPDLSNAFLRNADLSGGDLTRVNLADADLTGANLSGANLSEADLRDAILAGANLSGADLSNVFGSGANLSGANLQGANFAESRFDGAQFVGANLAGARFTKADFGRADLTDANLTRADFFRATFVHARLTRADLSAADLADAGFEEAVFDHARLADAKLYNTLLTNADLSHAMLAGADLAYAELTQADLTDANCTGANLQGALLFASNLTRTRLAGAALLNAMAIQTNFTGADLTGCRVYGLGAWDVILDGATQTRLVITKEEPHVHVDDLEVAQFVYLLLHRQKLRNVLTTLGERTVLLLGRFTERKALLERIADRLRGLEYLPIVFDFDRPTDRDITETIKVLAGLSLFVIADITNPRSVPLELQATVPDYMVPFVTLVERGQPVFGMFDDLPRKYDWALPLLEYHSADTLLAAFETKVVAPALEKLADVRRRKALPPPRRSAED